MVESGQYDTDSEVFRDGLRLIDARNRAIDPWLRHDVVPAMRKLKEDPSSALSAKEVELQMQERRKARRKTTA